MKPWFNARKAAQVAAFFVSRENTSIINVLKLTKLIYIADRNHMDKYDCPILGDELVSMQHGPVNSITLDCINGFEADSDGWEEFITSRSGYSVGLAKPILIDDLNELSDAEVDTLSETWSSFGTMTGYQVRDWTHDNCPEWESPHGSSNPIPYERVFKFLGKKHAEDLEEKVKENRLLCEVFARV